MSIKISPYKTKTKSFAGTSYKEVSPWAFKLYNQIKKKSKRRPYMRSVYFAKEKIFLELFWKHLADKRNLQDKMRRLKFFPCALELIEKSRMRPETYDDIFDSNITYYRFFGTTLDGPDFIVQIKENKKKKRKWLMSVFPAKPK